MANDDLRTKWGISSRDINPLQWRHNGRYGVSNHQPRDCLLNRLFGYRSKKTSKRSVTGHCAGNSPGTGEFPAQMTSNAENVSIWWRHHASPRENVPSAKLPQMRMSSRGNVHNFYLTPIWPGYPQLVCYQPIVLGSFDQLQLIRATYIFKMIKTLWNQ